MTNNDDLTPEFKLHVAEEIIAELLIENATLHRKIARLEAENAHLEQIKDPLRDNIGWSPVSDLTFD
jgi:hypothetical protein